MPELSEYPENDLKALSELASAEMATRAGDIDAAWAYYRGEHRKPLKVRKGQIDDNVIVNLARKVVDQGVSMLFGAPPTFDLPGDDAQVQATEAELARIWEANNAEILLHNIGVSGALAGHVFLKLVPEQSNRRMRFVLQNPRYCSVFWRPDDMQQVVCYKIEWGQGKTRYRQDIVKQNGSWLIRNLRKPEAGEWQVVDESVWAYDFAPIVDWQNLPNPEGYYGEPDLANAALNDAVNFVASNTNRILRHHAHPKTLGFGVQPNQIVETAVDGFWAGLPESARLENLEMQSDLASSMSFFEALQAAFYSEHQAVDLSTMKDRIGQLTNFGLRVLFKDAGDKNRTKRTLYGNGLCETSSRALRVLGLTEDVPTSKWADPLPLSDTELVQNEQVEVTLGTVSRQTAAEERGRDWEREQKRMAEEKALEQAGLGAAIVSAMRGMDRGEGADG